MDAATTTRSDARRRRSRRRAVVVAAVIVVAALGAGAALTSCSGGGDDASKTTTTAAPKTTVDIPLGNVSADSAGAAVTVPPDDSQHVLDALTTYVKGATVEPLRSGKPSTADFSAVFDPTTLTSATTTDRGVLLDEGLPKVTGNLTVAAQPVTLVGLGDQAGNLALITASMVVDAQGASKVKGAPLHVIRRADFTLQPDATGLWKITAYNVVVTRGGAGLSPTTTAGATTTTGAAK